MPNDFFKVYNSFFTGSMRAEDLPTRIVFLGLCSLCDDGGRVTATIGYIASHCAVELDQAKLALKRLLAPDKASTTREEDGRRVKALGPNQWLVVNYKKYYEKSREGDRKQYMREYMKEYRKGIKRRSAK